MESVMCTCAVPAQRPPRGPIAPRASDVAQRAETSCRVPLLRRSRSPSCQRSRSSTSSTERRGVASVVQEVDGARSRLLGHAALCRREVETRQGVVSQRSWPLARRRRRGDV
eukprot:3350048-Prymnesium_polylepis.1